MVLREIVNLIGFQLNRAQLNTATRNIEKLASKMQNVGRNLTFAVSAPIVAIGGLSIKAASDAEETLQKYNVVFRDVVDQANQATEELALGYNMTRDESRKLLSDTGDLLTGFGFQQDAALGLSTQVQKLAADLVSFSNFQGGNEEASRRITKALFGETEGVKELGIVIRQNTKEFRAQLKQRMRDFGETQNQAKAQLILAQAFEQSKNAIGDVERSSKSFANQFRTLRNRIKDVSTSFGQILLPTATKIVGVLTSLFERFNKLSNPAKRLILIVTGITAAIGPLIFAVGALSSAFLFLLANPVVLTIVAITAAIVALIGVIGLLIEDIVQWRKGNDSLIGDLFKKFPILLTIIKLIIAQIRIFWNLLSLGFKVFREIFFQLVQFFQNNVLPIINKIIRLIGKIPGVRKAVKGLGDGVRDLERNTTRLADFTGTVARDPFSEESLALRNAGFSQFNIKSNINTTFPNEASLEQQDKVQESIMNNVEQTMADQIAQLQRESNG